MGVLDELRYSIENFRGFSSKATFLQLVADFKREHPGLIDLTTCGEACPACDPEQHDRKGNLVVLAQCASLDGPGNAPLGQPCPVLARRSTP